MKTKLTLLTIILLALPGAVSAHHGSTSYDMDKSVTIKGTVTDFQFVNPHVLIYMDVKDASGKVTNWAGELTSPNHLQRLDWTKNTLKVGDEVTMTGAPLKSGAPRLWARKLSNASGELKTGGTD
jgi:Family of unknown function (DUF6152)